MDNWLRGNRVLIAIYYNNNGYFTQQFYSKSTCKLIDVFHIIIDNNKKNTRFYWASCCSGAEFTPGAEFNPHVRYS